MEENRVTENFNFSSAFIDMEKKEILDNGILAKLKEIEKTQYKLIQQRGDELEAFLKNLNDKTYKEAIDAINQKYNANVKEE
jgi:Ca-activated chloride channel family protein